MWHGQPYGLGLSIINREIVRVGRQPLRLWSIRWCLPDVSVRRPYNIEAYSDGLWAYSDVTWGFADGQTVRQPYGIGAHDDVAWCLSEWQYVRQTLRYWSPRWCCLRFIWKTIFCNLTVLEHTMMSSCKKFLWKTVLRQPYGIRAYCGVSGHY